MNSIIRSLAAHFCGCGSFFLLGLTPCARRRAKSRSELFVGGAMATALMAKESGAFEKNGIQVKFDLSSGPVVVQALIGGDLLHGGSAATMPSSTRS